MSSRRIIALVLAAGQSRRMGEPKQFLRYGEGTILEAVLDAVMESTVDGLVVVANPQVETFLRGRLPEDSAIAVNSEPDSEMLRSVQIGFAAAVEQFEPMDDEGILVLLGDQPEVRAGVIASMSEAWRLPRHPPGILIASYRGRRGHPTIFSTAMLREVCEWPADRKLNELAEAYPEKTRNFPVTTAPMPTDINTPDDYKRLVGE